MPPPLPISHTNYLKPSKMDNQTSNKSMFIKTNSSIIDDYFKIINFTKQMKNLQFPNSLSESENFCKKSVYRPDRKTKKRKKLEKYSTNLRNSLSNKSTEISSVLFYSKDVEEEIKFDNNLLINSPPISINSEDNKFNASELKISKKYSWEDVRNWIPPSEKRKLENNECKIKYSWEIIGVECQTSDTLIKKLRRLKNDDTYPCKIKYSWEVIGIGTQVSLHDFSHLMDGNDYWEGRIVTGSGRHTSKGNNASNSYETNKYRFVCNTGTQCTADKGVHTDLTDCTVKYSWQNLTKAYLRTVDF